LILKNVIEFKFDSELENVQNINIILAEIVSNLVSISGILGSIINGLLISGGIAVAFSEGVAASISLTSTTGKVIVNGSKVLGSAAIILNLLLIGYNTFYYYKKEKDYAKTFKETTEDIDYIKIEYERFTVTVDQRVGDLIKTFKENLKK